jgi:glucose-1-phosphate thymidylyltransferase
MQAFILAGGFATRLWPLTEKRAKPLLPLAGKPLLTHLIEGLPKELQIHVSTNASFEEGFRMWQREQQRESLHLVIEDTRSDGEKLGALGAFAKWLTEETIDDDVLLLTGDNYFGIPLSKILEAFDGKTALVAAHDLGEKSLAKGFGTVITEGTGKLRPVTAFEEKPLEPKTSLVSTGCSVIPKALLPHVREFAKRKPDNVGGLFEELLKEGHSVMAFEFAEPWLDIGSFQTYIAAHKLVVGEKVVQGEGSTCVNTKCEGSVVLGPKCSVKNAELKDCIVFAGARIENCTLMRCIVDDGCVLSGLDLRDKMLRAGTRLELQ